jgi:hypothetical protein
MRTRAFIFGTLVAGLSACATSPDTPAAGSPAHDDSRYSQVLIYAEAPDREWRESLETSLARELSDTDVTAIPAFTMSDGMAAAEDVDAVIVIAVSETGVREQWIEQPAMSGTLSSNSLAAIGGPASGPSPAQCKTRELAGAGFAAEVPWAVIAISVIDRETKETVWKSAAKFEGAVRSDFEDLRQDYARSVARKMNKDGLW